MHYTLNDLSLYSFPLLPSLLSIPLLFPFALSLYSFPFTPFPLLLSLYSFPSPLPVPFHSLFLYSFPFTLSLYSFPLLLSLSSNDPKIEKKIGSKKEVISILKNARFTRSGAFFGFPDSFVCLPFPATTSTATSMILEMV